MLAFAAFYLALPIILGAGTAPLERFQSTTLARWPVRRCIGSPDVRGLCGWLDRWMSRPTSGFVVTRAAAVQLARSRVCTRPSWLLSPPTAVEFAKGGVAW